jgi:2-polyprenyl-3-methyl-5-hydroxy-6-metoxy-1,4-benzoquinol methylase
MVSNQYLKNRFQFGENWMKFLDLLDNARIERASESLCSRLEVKDLNGKSFLDIGSGSGLFSLAARRLGAKVHSFDYDPQSVACAEKLKQLYFPDDAQWLLEKGSAIDKDYLAGLGKFDIVYSWGVLHHTGAMWSALENIIPLVAEGGKLFIAIYNDQGRTSHIWAIVKKIYNHLPPQLRWLVLGPALIRLWAPTILKDLLKGEPFLSWKNYEKGTRAMSPWHDLVDWVGGYPFEVAKPEEIFSFYRDRGFFLQQLSTCAGGIGCNEFVFINK